MKRFFFVIMVVVLLVLVSSPVPANAGEREYHVINLSLNFGVGWCVETHLPRYRNSEDLDGVILENEDGRKVFR